MVIDALSIKLSLDKKKFGEISKTCANVMKSYISTIKRLKKIFINTRKKKIRNTKRSKTTCFNKATEFPLIILLIHNAK